MHNWELTIAITNARIFYTSHGKLVFPIKDGGWQNNIIDKEKKNIVICQFAKLQ